MEKQQEDVKMTLPGITALVLAVATVVLAGCASTTPAKPAVSKQDEFGVFYDGESEAAYATAFPVASPEEAYHNGDTAARGGDHDRALFEYIRGLRLAGEPRVEVLYKIASIHHGRNNHRLAELAYRWALKIDPGHARAGTGLGLVLLQRRQYDAAWAQLKLVADTAGQAPWQTYNALGILADMDGTAAEAEALYQQALAANPGSALIFNNLGYSRYLAGDWDGAAAALQQALQVNPDYGLAWRNMGLVYARQKKYPLALEALRRTVKEPEAYNDVGFVAMMEGEYVQALAFFEKAMQLSPTYYVTASENADNARRMLDRRVASSTVEQGG